MDSNPRRVRWPLSCTLSWDLWKIQDWSISRYRRHVDEMVWSESGKAACATQVPPGKKSSKETKKRPNVLKKGTKKRQIFWNKCSANEGPLGRYNFLYQIIRVFYCLPIFRGPSGPIFRPRWVKMTKNYFSKFWGQTNSNEGSYAYTWTNLQKW